MYSYIFASTDTSIENASKSIEALDEVTDDFFEVVLSSAKEFEVLLNLLGISDAIKQIELQQSDDFNALYDYSSNSLPEMTIEDFDEFYQAWLNQSGRDTDMDEYGQLIFLQGQASNWNKNEYRFVLQAKP